VKTKFHTIIIGSGAAGLNCAVRLVREGVKADQIAIITDNLEHGTSFDAGSDKQTYYKLSVIGASPDSPVQMAHTLFDGGAMHGDIALVEATGSVQAFMHLVNIGVPFPYDPFGGFVGYKTDNDPLQRGTSAGPLTSRMMGYTLLEETKRLGISILSNFLTIEILKSPTGQACGVLAIDLSQSPERNHIAPAIIWFHADFVVLATGGPAGMYEYSVYPPTQWGATSLAIEAGCILQNLTESQFGLASRKFRWNVSGTYQQVIPTYFSVPADGEPFRDHPAASEFLHQYFPSITELTTAIFLKGYQWPFNPARIANYGSSLVDLAIHHEIFTKGRRVFMDFRSNPTDFSWDQLAEEPRQYLERSGANQSRPIDRLNRMNPHAIELYRDHGINLYEEPLEIAICAQHCNGGVTGDIWWQTNVPRLFAIGEVNGSHGVHRPGGSALNSGQVGGFRVAQKITKGKWDGQVSDISFNRIAMKSKNRWIQRFGSILNTESVADNKERESIFNVLDRTHHRMTRTGMYLRNKIILDELLPEIEYDLKTFFDHKKIPDELASNTTSALQEIWRIWDALLCQHAFFRSMQEYSIANGGSRGSAMILAGEQMGMEVHPLLPKYRMQPENLELRDQILTIIYPEIEHNGIIQLKTHTEWVKCRPIPSTTGWFENVWRDFNEKAFF
jgi:succinate dehydrogenase/fumarate reductase flavoprotein subunit